MTTAVSVQDPDIVVGLDLGWRDLTVTPEAVRHHAAAVDDLNPCTSTPLRSAGRLRRPSSSTPSRSSSHGRPRTAGCVPPGS